MDDDVKKRLAGVLDKAGTYLVSEVRVRLNTAQRYKRYTGASGVYYKGFDPSKPGAYPKKLSGQLIKSIAWNVDEDKLILTVGTAIKWGKFLEHGTRHMSPRPWLGRTFNEVRPALERLLDLTRGPAK